MNKLLIFLILLGCQTTTTRSAPRPIAIDYSGVKRMDSLERQQIWLLYEMEIRECFYNLRFCQLERKQRDCWPVHERCVIDSTNKFHHVLSKRGFE